MKHIIMLTCFFVALSGCVMTPPRPPMTALQIREFQTREYQIRDTKLVMKAMLNVLQDDGFIVKNAVSDLGLLSATKEVDLEDQSSAVMNSILFGSEARWEKNSVIEATANVTEFGKETRVRLTFQRKTLDNRGSVLKIENIEDPTFYQDFFAKVDKGIFIQGQRL